MKSFEISNRRAISKESKPKDNSPVYAVINVEPADKQGVMVRVAVWGYRRPKGKYQFFSSKEALNTFCKDNDIFQRESIFK